MKILLFLLNEGLRAFNEIFRRDVAYNNIKSKENQIFTLSVEIYF